MPRFVTLYLSQNLARRHEPTLCLNRLMDELLPFTYLERDVHYLSTFRAKTAFPFLPDYLGTFADKSGRLPRFVPLALIQEPNLNQGRITGFPGKRILCSGQTPRAAIITMNNANVTLIDSLSDGDCAWGLISYRKTKMALCSFYSDINSASIELNLTNAYKKCPWVALFGDSNAHSSLWGSPSNNIISFKC